MFIYFERENERGEREHGTDREKGRGRIPSRLCTVSTKPDVGLDLTTVRS